MIQPVWRGAKRIGLRGRLTLTYTLIFAVLLAAIGLLFRETLHSILEGNTMEVLDEEWAALKGFLRIRDGVPVWIYNQEGTEEPFIVQRLRRVFLLADESGEVLEVSEAYRNFGVESPEQIRRMAGRLQRPLWRIRESSTGRRYLTRTGVHYDDGRRPFVLTIGRSLADDERILEQFTVRYFTVMPLLILGAAVLGWLVAGRALRPLNDLTLTAQSITGDRLDLHIPPRGTGDELDQLIDTFNGMVDRLQSSFTQVRQFSVDVSHELRTPLTAIRGQLEVALLTARTVEEYREAMLSAIDDVERLSKVVTALLQLSQAESGQLPVAREKLDLAELAAHVVEQYQIPAEMEGLRVRTALDAGCVVQGDRIQLERLLANLVSNALKYTPAGGEVAVSCRQVNGQAELVVEDTGKGIPEEHLPHIFERFYRVPDGTSDPLKGLGLGLSFVAWIARAHDATVHADSRPGKGTKVRVVFPSPQKTQAAETPLASVK